MNTIERHLTHGDEHRGKRTPLLQPSGAIIHAMGYQIRISQDVLDHYGDVGMLGEVVYAAEWLDRIGYSAHVLGAPRGEIIRCRWDDEIAWHCKANEHNWKSLGYEFLVLDALTWGEFLEAIRTNYVSQEQFQSGVETVAEWARTYEFGIDAIRRHSDEDSGKPDPGDGFPWDDFLADVERRI